jgi:hypothetical protein
MHDELGKMWKNSVAFLMPYSIISLEIPRKNIRTPFRVANQFIARDSETYRVSGDFISILQDLFLRSLLITEFFTSVGF